MSFLKAEAVSYAYGKVQALSDVSLSLRRGGFLGILGPNGSGKSTLLRLLGGYLRADSGRIILNGKGLGSYRRKELARILSYVPQNLQVDFPFTCREVVMMGRAPHQGLLGIGGSRDLEIVEESMRLTGCAEFSSRLITQLSGGEAQRVFIAQALAQQGEILILDEPTSHLDIKYQVELMILLKKLRSELGLTVVLSLHDLNLASMYCEEILLLSRGRLFRGGESSEVLNPPTIQEVYQIEVSTVICPQTKRPFFLPRAPQG